MFTRGDCLANMRVLFITPQYIAISASPVNRNTGTYLQKPSLGGAWGQHFVHYADYALDFGGN